MFVCVCVCVYMVLVHEMKGVMSQWPGDFFLSCFIGGGPPGVPGAVVNENLPGEPVKAHLLFPPSLHLGPSCQLVDEDHKT